MFFFFSQIEFIFQKSFVFFPGIICVCACMSVCVSGYDCVLLYV